MKANNIQNGGLVCKANDKLILAGQVCGAGMYWVKNGITQESKEVAPWFMNVDEDETFVYYSDACKERHLCKMSVRDRLEVTLLSEPVCLLQRYEDELFYINEKDRKLYSYAIEERGVRKVINEEVTNFIIAEGSICYSNEKGIYVTELSGAQGEKVSKQKATRLIYDENTLIFTNQGSQYEVYFINLQSGEERNIAGSMSSSMVAVEGQIFYSDAKESSHIYRYSIESDLQFKIVPERADYLHLIEDTLYYFNRDKQIWMQVPVQGGKPLPVLE